MSLKVLYYNITNLYCHLMTENLVIFDKFVFIDKKLLSFIQIKLTRITFRGAKI